MEEEDSWNTKLTEWKFKRKEDLGKKSKREETILWFENAEKEEFKGNINILLK